MAGKPGDRPLKRAFAKEAQPSGQAASSTPEPSKLVQALNAAANDAAVEQSGGADAGAGTTIVEEAAQQREHGARTPRVVGEEFPEEESCPGPFSEPVAVWGGEVVTRVPVATGHAPQAQGSDAPAYRGAGCIHWVVAEGGYRLTTLSEVLMVAISAPDADMASGGRRGVKRAAPSGERPVLDSDPGSPGRALQASDPAGSGRRHVWPGDVRSH